MSRVSRATLPLRAQFGRGHVNLEVAGVAERLVHEFPEVAATVVIEAVCECADDCESAGPFFIEQAVRARLCAMRQEPAPVVIPAQPRAVEEQLELAAPPEIDAGRLPA
jgi:hypothetical protein